MTFRQFLCRHCLIAFALACTIPAARPASLLADAVMNRDSVSVQRLLRTKTDVNAPQPDGTTALHWAVRLDDSATTDALLRAGANVKAANRFGVTPLGLACINANAMLIERLLRAGADVNAPLSPTGETPLMMAAGTGNPAAVKLLLDHGAKIDARENTRGQTALLWAAAQEHIPVVRLLLEHGADVNTRSQLQLKAPAAGETADCPPSHPLPTRDPVFSTSDRAQRTKHAGDGCISALIFAVRQGNHELVHYLLEKGADVNLTMGDGTSPLNVAIINAHYELASLLLDKGADPNIVDGKGMGALYGAVDMRNIRNTDVPNAKPDDLDPLDLIKKILDHGANVNVRLIAKVPYRGGTNPTWQSEVGATSFLRAAYSNDVVVMRLLLAHGANPNINAADKTTPLMAAAGVGWMPSLVFTRDENLIESLKICLEAGNDVNAANDGKPNSGGPSGLTALHGAAFKGLPEAVQLLFDHGANLYAKDFGISDAETRGIGRTPLEWAEGVAFEAQSPRLEEKTASLLRKLMAEHPPATR